MNRNTVIVGVFALLAAASAIGFGIMFTLVGRDACLDGPVAGGSCPALAVVNGERYSISEAAPVAEIGSQLTQFGVISRTNSPQVFTDMTVYSVAGIDPRAVLIGNAATSRERFVTLFGPELEAAWPAFCQYLPPVRAGLQPECS